MKCDKCGGDGRIYIVDRVVQGQDYGPETEGHYEKCSKCGGKGKIPSPKRFLNKEMYECMVRPRCYDGHTPGKLP